MVATAAVLLGAMGLWWLLPWDPVRRRRFGWLPVVAAIGLLAAQLKPLGTWLDGALASIFSLMALISAVAAVTTRKPLYCALWFGMTVLGTAGLILYSGAQFLAVATVVVYVGAILVTFLFLLMLDRPDGGEPYDRTSWSPLVSSLIGLALVGVLSACLARTAGRGQVWPVAATEMHPLTATEMPAPVAVGMQAPVATGEPSQAETGRHPVAEAPAADHMAETPTAVTHTADLGRSLYIEYFAAVQIVALLLLAALLGATVIIGRPLQPLQEIPSPPGLTSEPRGISPENIAQQGRS